MAVLANSGLSNGIPARDRVHFALDDERSHAFVGEPGDFIAAISKELGMTSEAVRRGINVLYHEGLVAKLMVGRFIIGCGLVESSKLNRTEARFVGSYADAEWVIHTKRKRAANPGYRPSVANRPHLRSVMTA